METKLFQHVAIVTKFSMFWKLFYTESITSGILSRRFALLFHTEKSLHYIKLFHVSLLLYSLVLLKCVTCLIALLFYSWIFSIPLHSTVHTLGYTTPLYQSGIIFVSTNKWSHYWFLFSVIFTVVQRLERPVWTFYVYKIFHVIVGFCVPWLRKKYSFVRVHPSYVEYFFKGNLMFYRLPTTKKNIMFYFLSYSQ